jgi:hypothetical protein
VGKEVLKERAKDLWILSFLYEVFPLTGPGGGQKELKIFSPALVNVS